MAKRPIFIPDDTHHHLFQEIEIEFSWSGGFAEVQKKKNVKALHEAAFNQGYKNILEISTKSDEEIGKKLSAFNLKYPFEDKFYPLESVYQASKTFKDSGPFPEILELAPRDAKRYIREKDHGTLIEYRLGHEKYPLSPPNAFYDWLYIRALARQENNPTKNLKHEAFTDIEFNPKKQINCQARSLAIYISLMRRDELSKSVADFEYFKSFFEVI